MSSPLPLKLIILSLLLVGIGVSLLAKGNSRRQGLAFIFAWMIPGAGHVFLGKWKKGLFFFAILAVTWLAGMAIVGFRAVSFDDNPFYYIGQFGSGITTLLAQTVSKEKAFPRPEIHPGWFDPGLLYVCVVGLLNLVLVLNVLDVKIQGEVASPSASEKTA